MEAIGFCRDRQAGAGRLGPSVGALDGKLSNGMTRIGEFKRGSKADAAANTPMFSPVVVAIMCGRFTQHLSWAEIHYLADLIGQPRNLAPRYNIAPTTRIEVIRPAAGQ